MDIRALWTAVLAQDEEAIRPFFHPDARVDWVCTNERFTLDEYITANCRYPGCRYNGLTPDQLPAWMKKRGIEK